ncbi:MAG TPA: iron-containing alcohol dehydrogenase, partial [Rubrobacteraceae bacterium]|nr:iron-containing alcohol dehydrogenase [Rubrobacteraceae bacterium]
GGSSMDAAKGISLHAANGGSVLELDYRNTPERPGFPVIAVPTTAGTGSETNGFGVIMDHASGRKFYAGHASVRPEVAVLDPLLTVGLPPAATAATGVDALTHALEALMSRNGNPYAEGLALQVIRMVATWLPVAVRDGDDVEARSRMLMAAHLAGLAFGSGTGLGLCHAIAHSISARLEAAHGVALASVLPQVMAFNLPASADELALAATSLGVSDPGAGLEANAAAAVEAVERLVAEVMGRLTPGSLGVTGDVLPVLVRDTIEDGVISNTPRMPSPEEVESLLVMDNSG